MEGVLLPSIYCLHLHKWWLFSYLHLSENICTKCIIYESAITTLNLAPNNRKKAKKKTTANRFSGVSHVFGHHLGIAIWYQSLKEIKKMNPYSRVRVSKSLVAKMGLAAERAKMEPWFEHSYKYCRWAQMELSGW
jgi:hypothetical protein